MLQNLWELPTGVFYGSREGMRGIWHGERREVGPVRRMDAPADSDASMMGTGKDWEREGRSWRAC